MKHIAYKLYGERVSEANIAFDGAKEIVRTKDIVIYERFALADQMRRAVISVPSNIAEGLSRTAPKEQAHFLDIAYGSLMETDCQLDISLDLGYISREMREMLDVEINSIGKMIRSLKSHRQ